MGYVVGEKKPGCIFCHALTEEDETDSLMLFRGERNFIILNLYPYNSGHMMVVPNQHVPSLEDLDSPTRAEMFDLSTLAIEAARSVLRCDGFNLGMNIGEIAGAGVADHLHFHIVPRWVGDANFMPIVADTTVMPELITATHARLRAEIETITTRRQTDLELASGAIVYLPERDAVVLRRTNNGELVLPKGHVESGETAAETAIREIREETGIAASLSGWAGNERITFDSGKRSMFVTYFLAIGEETPETASHLETDTVLVPAAEAAESVSFDNLKEIVQRGTDTLLQRVGQQ